MRRLLLSFLAGAALVAFAPAALLSAGSGTIEERVRRAMEAYRDHDYVAYRLFLTDAAELRPGHPLYLYNLAGAHALTGDSTGALEILSRLAEMGLSCPAQTDSDFVSLKRSPAFMRLEERFARNLDPAGAAETAFRIGSGDMLAEGIAYDPVDSAFYVSGVHRRTILTRSRDGAVDIFVPEGSGGAPSVFGIVVDAAGRMLWASTATIQETDPSLGPIADSSAVVGYDLETGRKLAALRPPLGTTGRQYGDLHVAADGEIYASDGRSGTIDFAPAGAERMQVMIPPGILRSPQGIAALPGDPNLFVADYALGLCRLNRRTKEVRILAPPSAICLTGIDGLAATPEGLVAIQNGVTPPRIIRIRLDADRVKIVGCDILASNLPEFGEPTLGVTAGPYFYFVANSPWGRFQNGNPPRSPLDPARIMRIRIR